MERYLPIRRLHAGKLLILSSVTLSFVLGAVMLFAGSPQMALADTCTHQIVGNWQYRTPIPEEAVEASVAEVNGKLYVIGGFSRRDNNPWYPETRTHIYDPATDTWSNGAELPVRTTHAPAAVDGTDIWVAGGFINWWSQGNGWTVTDNVWKYDSVANTWTAGPALPEPRAAGAMVRVGRNLHYITGSEADRRTDSTKHWVLNLDGATGWNWVESVPLPDGRQRNHVSHYAANGKIYLLGGVPGHDIEPTQDSAFVDVFDTATNTWQALPDLDAPRSHAEPGSMGSNGMAIIASGRSRPVAWATNSIRQYDPETGVTTVLGNFPVHVMSPASRIIGDYIYVVSGHASTSRVVRARIEYTCAPDPDPTDPPVDPTDPPADPTDPPVDPTDPPVNPTDPPADPTEPPADPTEPPVDPTDPPADPTDPPVDPTDPPADPTDLPVDPTDPPAEVTSEPDSGSANPPGGDTQAVALSAANNESGTTAANATNSENGTFSAFDPFITKFADPPFALPGEAVTFTFVVQNPGTVPVSNVRAVDPIPADVAILDVSAPSGAVTISGQDVIFTIPTLQPGERVTITITTKVRGDAAMPFNIINRACVEGDGIPDDQCATAGVLSISSLPRTGETPLVMSLLRSALAMLPLLGGGMFVAYARRRRVRQPILTEPPQ